MTAAVVWVAGALLGWTWLIYPLSLRWRRSIPPAAAEFTPRVVLFIAARNEAEHIGARVRNARALDYPGLRVVVVSDGSTDGTDAAAAPAEVFRMEQPRGKTAALVGAVRDRGGDAEVLAFTDATARWDPGTLRALVRPLGDPEVGAVRGDVQYDYPDARSARGFRRYQRTVVRLRAREGDTGSVTSVSGSIHAVRADLFADAPPELSYDLVHPMEVAAAGLRTVWVRDARSLETARGRISREFRSRVRLAFGAYAFMGHLWRNRRRLPRAYLVRIVSHKVLRWLTPLLSVLLLLCGGWPGWIALASALVLASVVPPLQYAVTVSAAYLVALAMYVAGRRVAGWEPEDQR